MQMQPPKASFLSIVIVQNDILGSEIWEKSLKQEHFALTVMQIQQYPISESDHLQTV